MKEELQRQEQGQEQEEKYRCRAREAIEKLEQLLRLNRNFRPRADMGEGGEDLGQEYSGCLHPWLFIAHTRARRCRGRRQVGRQVGREAGRQVGRETGTCRQ